MKRISILFIIIIFWSPSIKSQEIIEDFLNGPIYDVEQLIDSLWKIASDFTPK